ncbi:MAG: hypothetical protein FWC11_02065 [Firmicutes bacterium]|nr:hypothetical protein [Bacillota bacterium]MCL2255625.1 hypothetical protein [Bacillota bacterium]
MNNFDHSILFESHKMNTRFKRRAGGRIFGLIVHLLASIFATALAIVIIAFPCQIPFLPSVFVWHVLIMLGIATLFWIQTLYYFIMFVSNSNLQKPYRSAVLAIIFFPVLGFTHIFFVALERNDKRKTSRINFEPIAKEFKNIESSTSDIRRIRDKRLGQISFWTGSVEQIENLSPQVRASVEGLDTAIENFLTVVYAHGLGVFFQNAKAMKYMIECAMSARKDSNQVKDIEGFFARHVRTEQTTDAFLKR